MAELTAEYGFSQPLAYARELVADSTCLQAIAQNASGSWPQIKAAADAGGLNRDLAKTLILADSVFQNEEFQEAHNPPWVLLRHGLEWSSERQGSNVFETDAFVSMLIELPTPAEYRGYDAERLYNATIDFQNKVGRIIQEMKDVIKTLTAGRLQVDRFGLLQMGAYDPDDYGGNWVRAAEFQLFYKTSC